jgi:16S rRNA processing protein RimM
MAARKKAKNVGSGSPSDGEPEYLVVGSLRRAHGVRGEIVMEVVTDFPERLQSGTQVYLGSLHTPMMIHGVRSHSEGLLIKFTGIDTPEEAARHRNKLVYVTTADRPPLPEGHYYEHQVLGFAVVDHDTDETIGALSEILRTGANDIYVVKRPDGAEVLLPVIPSVVLDLDMNRRMIRVHLLPGLIEDRGS